MPSELVRTQEAAASPAIDLVHSSFVSNEYNLKVYVAVIAITHTPYLISEMLTFFYITAKFLFWSKLKKHDNLE